MCAPSGHFHITNNSPLPGWLSKSRVQLPDSMHTGWAALQFGPYRATTHIICVTFALYKLYFISCFTLLPFSSKQFTLYWRGSPHSGNLFPASPSPTTRHRFCFSSSYTPSPILIPSTQVCLKPTLWWLGSSVSIYLMLWENYWPCRSIISDLYIERGAFHILLHFCLLWTSQFFLESSIILFPWQQNMKH